MDRSTDSLMGLSQAFRKEVVGQGSDSRCGKKVVGFWKHSEGGTHRFF